MKSLLTSINNNIIHK